VLPASNDLIYLLVSERTGGYVHNADRAVRVIWVEEDHHGASRNSHSPRRHDVDPLAR
jgi:hypothetical protein